MFVNSPAAKPSTTDTTETSTTTETTTRNSPTKPSDESSRINSKASDPCSWFGQSGLRLMFLLAKANRFLIRVIISNLRNGISWNILSGLLSVVKVWNLKNDFRYNAACFVSGDLSQLSVHLLYICSTHLRLYDPLMRLLFFSCFVLRFYKKQLGLDWLIWKIKASSCPTVHFDQTSRSWLKIGWGMCPLIHIPLLWFQGRTWKLRGITKALLLENMWLMPGIISFGWTFGLHPSKDENTTG